jgi:hypothetical protein
MRIASGKAVLSTIGTYLDLPQTKAKAAGELPIKSLRQYREQARWVYTGWRFWNGGLSDHILNSRAKLRRRITLHDTGVLSQLAGGGGYKLRLAQTLEYGKHRCA